MEIAQKCAQPCLPRDGDTIFAPATASGRAAVSVVRISGPKCRDALAVIAPHAEFVERRATLKTIMDPNSGAPIDRALVTLFQGPASFTGEDVVELSITGGRAVVEALLGALSLLKGLRLAEPGEFSWRAFRNGKIDLSQAEGLVDLIEAETEAQRRQAQRVAGGALKRECEAIRALLIEAMAILEARIDFSDHEDVEQLDNAEIYNRIRLALHRVECALGTARSAERLREGFFVVIAGAPNVGKSTLLNALVGRELAITSPQAGTTRDSIEAFLNLAGYPVTLVDTAGLRESDDALEREGIRRARERAHRADLILWLDDTGENQPPDFIGPHLRVRTKMDELGSVIALDDFDVAVSARTGDGLEKLLDAITALAVESMSTAEPTLLTLRRHRDAFLDAQETLSEALVEPPLEPEFWADHLRHAAAALERVTGRIGVEDILGEIFGRLCIGK